MLTIKTFIDTNMLVYSIDRHNPRKQRQARILLTQLERERTGVISTQVMQEFYVAAVKKLNVEPLNAKAMLEALTFFEIVIVDIGQIRNAIDCSILNRISFWDSLIIASAERSRCFRVWSEDFNHGQILRGVTIVNPFI
ncbi:MAG: PIN domain-containing protein [Lentisphaerae bacterium]|nr:PIN domain-containing protein [Lentisphaerota bacterium]